MFAGKRSLVWSALAAVFAMAFWMRLQFIAMYGQPSYLAWAGDHYFGSLSGFYVMAAEAWRRGEPYRELIYPPGYVAFLATVGDVFGTGATTLRTVQAAFDASAVAAVYMIGGAVGLSAPWALAPAAVYAILPLWAASSTFLLAESLAVPLLLWALVLVVISARARSVWMALAAGAWSGLSALVRPDFALVFVPAALILVLVRRERRLIGAAMFCLAFAVAVGSWGVHNRRLHGAWVFTSTGGGASLWEGLGEIENPYGYVLDDSAANHQLIPRGYGWASIDGSAFLTREYLKAWRDHPAFVLRVVASRMVRILTQSDRLQPLFFGRVREWLDAFGLITLAAAVWLARRNRLAVLLLIVLPMYALISIGLVHFEPRYVRYVEVAYVLGAAIVCSRLASVALERWPRATLAVVVLFCLAGSVYTVRELVAVRAAALAGVEQP